MDNQQFSKIVKNFFTCDRSELLEIFNELLRTMEVEETLAPNELMSQNYETAQANPEIHTLPGNLRDARDSIFPFFWGTDGWYSKLHLENVKGPANYASLIGSLACLLKNPNLCVDTYSQRSNELEVKVITALANLVFYHTESPWGIFTMGGTISNLYGGKIGIEKVCPQAMEKGIGQDELAGIVSQAGHYSNTTLAGWLGIGTQNLHSVPTDDTCAMRLDMLLDLLDTLYQQEKKVAFVIATFGSTDAFGMDDVKEIRRIIGEKAAAYDMPVPQLHVDGAVGWSLCFLDEYNVEQNSFKFDAEILPDIVKIQEKCQSLRFADSITIDFHKMGWGHYPSSAFIVNRREDLQFLYREKELIPYFCEAQYRRDPALFTLECSRPALGPYSVMASLNGIGLTGFQMLVAHALELALYTKKRLDELAYCKVLNSKSAGTHVVWWVLPKGRNAKQIFKRLEEGELSEKEYQRYCAETKHLFEKRRRTMDSQKEACLSFTTSMGYQPGGNLIPAWKAVFFNPKTDKQVVDDLIRSIEEL